MYNTDTYKYPTLDIAAEMCDIHKFVLELSGSQVRSIASECGGISVLNSESMNYDSKCGFYDILSK